MKNCELNLDLSCTINLSKEFILSKVREEEIWSFYGVPIKKGLFCSKLRPDKHPTCALYRNKSGRLIMKDFGSDWRGDCFAYVAALNNASYMQALRIIANDFNLIKLKNIVKNKPIIKYDGEIIPETKTAIIQVEIREWQDYELNWWLQFGITKETLKKYHVYSCKNVFLNGQLFHLEKDRQFIFGYYGGIKDGIELWRIYMPLYRSYKFISNWPKSKIQGVHMLPKEGDYVVITKSMKDLMLFHEYNIPSIAPCSENLFLTENQYKKLKERFKRIYLLYDYDLPGINAAIKIKKEHPDIKVLLTPKGHKDLTDFRKACGKRKTIELINKALEYYGEKGNPEKKANE